MREIQSLSKLSAAGEFFLPCIALGELYYGAWKSARTQENMAQIEAFAKANVVLECNADTAREYGKIKNLLRTKGRFIPENDIWIASIAVQHGLAVFTKDTHFQEIDQLPLASW